MTASLHFSLENFVRAQTSIAPAPIGEIMKARKNYKGRKAASEETANLSDFAKENVFLIIRQLFQQFRLHITRLQYLLQHLKKN